MTPPKKERGDPRLRPRGLSLMRHIATSDRLPEDHGSAAQPRTRFRESPSMALSPVTRTLSVPGYKEVGPL